MNTSIRSKLAVAAVTFGALWAVQAANAHTDVYFSVGVPLQPAPVYMQPVAPVYVPAPQVVYERAPAVYVAPADGDDSRWEQQRAWREAQWRRQQWREHEWRQRQWRERQWEYGDDRHQAWRDDDD